MATTTAGAFPTVRNAIQKLTDRGLLVHRAVDGLYAIFADRASPGLRYNLTGGELVEYAFGKLAQPRLGPIAIGLSGA